MEPQYKIGDISRKLGISRDTLRFYEKKGIIHPRKQENGYRYYSYEDIRILYDILFFRKYRFSLEDIYGMILTDPYDSIEEKFHQKIEEETELLEQRRRSLNNLMMNQAIISQAKTNYGRYVRQTFPEFYRLEEDIVSANQQALEVCYIYDEYTISHEDIQMTGQYMLIPSLALSGLDKTIPIPPENKIQHRDSIFTVVESDTYSPSSGQLLEAVDWVQKNGLQLAGTIYAGHLLHYQSGDKHVYRIGVYLPLQ